MNRTYRIALFATIGIVVLLLVVLAVVPAVSLVRGGGPATRDPDPTTDDLRRERAYLEGRLAAAADPLIGIAVDPVVGTISIELGGVSMRTVRAVDTTIPWVLRSVPPDSMVLTRLADRTGLIPPEPVRRVEAPADTAEANRAPATVPVETTPSAVNLLLENGIVIRLDPDSTSGTQVQRFRLWERFRANLGTVADAIAGRPPRIRGEVRMRMADADAKAVFRALSTGSPVVLRSGPAY